MVSLPEMREMHFETFGYALNQNVQVTLAP